MGNIRGFKCRLVYVVVSLILLDILLVVYLCININNVDDTTLAENVIIKESRESNIEEVGINIDAESDVNISEVNDIDVNNSSTRNNIVKTSQGNVENNRGKVTNLTQEEYAIYVALIYCEVGAESYETKLAVANVVLNRMYGNVYPDTLKEVIYDPYQFSPVREGKLEVQINNFKAGKFTHSNHLECMKAADEAMAGRNNVGDRIGFLTPDYLEKLFGGKYRDKLVIGNVAFFNV